MSHIQKEKALDTVKTALEEQTAEGKLSDGFMLAFKPFDENKEEVNKLVSLYKEIKEKYIPKCPKQSDFPTTRAFYQAKSACDKIIKKNLETAGIDWPLYISLLSENPPEDQLIRKISRAIHEKNSRKIIFNEYLPKYNVIPLLLKVFKDVSITPIGEVILPIPGHEDIVKDGILVTAVK